jgi:beta-glucosidase
MKKPDFADWKPEQPLKKETGPLPVLAVSASAFETETAKYALSETVDPLAEKLSDEELCLLNIGAFRQKGSQSVIGNAGQSVAGAAGETVNCLQEKGIPALIMADGPAGLRLSRQYTRDEKGVHAIGDVMPESVMELCLVTRKNHPLSAAGERYVSELKCYLGMDTSPATQSGGKA